MTLAIGMITVDTLDPMPLAKWWAEQLDGEIVQENDGFFVVVAVAPGSPLIAFQQVEDPTPGKNRVHLDLTTENLAAEVERLVTAGATKIADREMPGFAWVTLADPDGNQFCVSGTHAESAD
ncbi:VOC family protein [Gordonia sp. zg691]|uniref:VOC family protein n=1 Tax=Gordonia jinghuaiqii TaxID=2758710 RepID=A0A7D7QFP8_9ACTN|nr:VOC family protein [Gordonia jinghuaiqii]MBD0862706.1 VOC family protein [Gordonia jinghuaiqii]MCR5976790.1 VOC family protein [Gordonia jinghuaiqii]QMS99961.1 VOC family protein [Gordonia jinghuaiqii]